MGLYRRGKTYWFSIQHDGRRIQESFHTENKRLADKLYAKVLSEIIEGRYYDKSEAKQHSFENLRDRYLMEHSQVNKAEKSFVRDRGSFKHLERFFEGYTLYEITPARISEYKALRQQEGAAVATLARELEVFRHAFNLAMKEWEWTDKTPFDRVKIEKPDNQIERWLTMEEEAELMKHAFPWVHNIVLFALHTGMRQGEILSLKWSEVDFKRRTATLLKTKNGHRRTAPLNRTVMELLAQVGKVRSITGYVFTTEHGMKVDASNLRRAFTLAKKKAGVEDFRFHDLRHTFATRLVQQGVELYVVKELMGHKSITMTMRYAHHNPESLRFGVDVLDKCYNSATVGQKERVREI